MKRSFFLLLALCSLAIAQGMKSAPTRISLDGSSPSLRLLLHEEGKSRGIPPTEWHAEVTPAGLVRIDAAGHVFALTDGRGQLRVKARGQSIEIPLEISGTGATPPVSFRREILPVLTRHDCNSGGCHGAASGKNGFALSLFGYDPGRDHQALTREFAGRRIETTDAESSLIVQKASAALPHEGGLRIAKDSRDYTALVRWIREGALDDPKNDRSFVALSLHPARIGFDQLGQRERIAVFATDTQGMVRDVTERALLSLDDPATASLDGDTVVANGAGTARLLARFSGLAALSLVDVVPEDRPAPKESAAAARTPLDHLIRARLQELKIPAPDLCDDRTFIRRLHLDLHNRLPSPETTQAFLEDQSPNKRDLWIDRLVDELAYAEALSLEWAEFLRIEARTLENKGVQVFSEWLLSRFAENMPFDQIARALLTAEGPSFQSPAANYWLVDRDPKVMAEHTAQVFLGMQLQCAQCHDHPFERWTMTDYYGFAAFFPTIGIKTGENPRERVILENPGGTIRHPLTGAIAQKRFLGAPQPAELKGAKSPRTALADWMTSAEVPAFAENIANRIFARFFGRGLVEPVDDVRISNPPSHPELHRVLGQRMIALGFDLKAFTKELLRSATYHQAVSPQDPPAQTFASAKTTRLRTEALLEAIDQVTGVRTRFDNRPASERPTTLPGPALNSRFLEVFGRSARESACACARREEPTLSQALHLINGETIEAKLDSDRNLVRIALKAGETDDRILEQLWLRAFSREPTASERLAVQQTLKSAESREAAWRDIQWSLLNTREFLFHH